MAEEQQRENISLGLDSCYFADTFLINPNEEQQSAQL